MTVPNVPTLLHVFPTFAIGGAQARFATLANSLGGRFQHAVLALDGRYDAKVRLLPDLAVAYPELVGSKGAFLRSILAYRRLLNEWRPSTLLTYNWGAIEFAFANILPAVRHIHVIDGFGPDEYLIRLRRRVMANRMALSSSTTIVPSRTLLDIVTNEWGLPPASVRYVPNGIDVGRFKARTYRCGTALPTTIGTVAALRPEKNVARLLLAFARSAPHSPMRLVVVGAGECRNELIALAGRLGVGDRVSFLGHRNDIEKQLDQLDIFALSSDTEQMPMVVLEAMASGIPVIATDVGDICTMVSDENATLIRGTTADGLARAIIRLSDDAALRVRIGRANRSKAERCFDQAQMVSAWESVLMEPMGG